MYIVKTPKNGDNKLKTKVLRDEHTSFQYHYLLSYRADDVIISLFKYHTLHYDIAPR